MDQCINLADEVRKKYNPENLSPFPYEKIMEDKKDLGIYIVTLPDGLSGVTSFDKDKNFFNIFIDEKKPKTRQHFTIAHELGHYFLHQEILRQEGIIVDGELDGNRSLFRPDSAVNTQTEREANNFAANLIMPQELVENAWKKIKNAEECAVIFNVSLSAMSIRLEKLGLID